MIRTLDLETLVLDSGAHVEPGELTMEAINGHACIMEAVAYVAGEPWTDSPACASPVIAAFCRAWNDTPEPYGQAIRDRLRSYILRLVGSRGTPAQEEQRAWLAVDWLIRVCAPAWMRLTPALVPLAETLAALPPQTSREAVASSAAARAAARDAARAAARDAAWDAAWDAARDAARDAASAAARDAAWDAASAAARDAARAAAWDAARAAAWDAAWDAARDAARAAAWAAAWDAARAAARDAARAAAWDAARAAAWDALQPTVETLQASAWQLLDAMLAVPETPDDLADYDAARTMRLSGE